MFDRAGNRKYLNWPEREAFLAVVQRETDARRIAFCLTLFYTGCRISEALQLTVERIDVTEQALVFETLKRRKRGQYRSVPIPEPLIVRLRELTACHSTGQRLWPYSRTTAYRLIKRKMDAAGITGVKGTPKGLRHSFAIACISRNVPLTIVKKWLGHARLETTTIYLEVSGAEERELAKRLWKHHPEHSKCSSSQARNS